MLLRMVGMRGRRRTAERAQLVLVVLLATLAVCFAGLAAQSFAASAGDVAATKALREAELRRERAIAKSAPEAAAARRAFVAAVGRECPGALHGAPQDEGFSSVPTPRKRGEHDRAERQLSSVQEEASGALSSTGTASFDAAARTFLAETSTLSWTDPRIRKVLDFEASLFAGTTTPISSASLCGDLRSWAQSGYRTLAPGTKAYVTSFEKAISEPPPGPLDPEVLLRPSESPASRRLEREIKRVRLSVRSTLGAFGRDDTRLRRELGVAPSPFEAREAEPVIGRGRTHSGETLVVKRASRGSFLGTGCKHAVTVQFRAHPRGQGVIRFGGSETEELCLSARGPARPQISCGQDLERLAMALPARATRVRLRLSDGSEIAARTVAIPRADGGPASVYAETLRGYEPHPVSLTALDAAGATVRSVAIPAAARCRRRPQPAGPKFIPLVHATTPSGEPFEIEGVLVRFGRHASFSVELSHPGNESSSSFSSYIAIGGGRPQAFEMQLSTGCQAPASWVIYGLLAPQGASVQVRTAAGLSELTRVPLAASYEARGPLEYGAFDSPPLEVIVRRADGTVLHSEAPVKKVVEEREYCEGFAEPSS